MDWNNADEEQDDEMLSLEGISCKNMNLEMSKAKYRVQGKRILWLDLHDWLPRFSSIREVIMEFVSIICKGESNFLRIYQPRVPFIVDCLGDTNALD